MEKGNTKKKFGIGLMIAGLAFMAVSYILKDNVDIVLIILGIVIIGNTVHFLGQKEAAKEAVE